MEQAQVQSALLRIVLVSLAGMLLLGVMSFWVSPSYAAGVQVAIDTFKEILLVTIGVKGGLAAPAVLK
jgi:capsular polysaccharide biosynthesis protein